jgi:hypothetical protein
MDDDKPLLNIDGAVCKALSYCPNFSIDREIAIHSPLGSERSIGCYKNDESSYTLITTKAFRVFENGNEEIVPFAEIHNWDVIAFKHPDWKKACVTDRSLRTYIFELADGRTVSMQIRNDTNSRPDGGATYDFLAFYSLTRKILLFEEKARTRREAADNSG